MRRQYVGRSDAMVRSTEGEQGFWPSYADMMSAVALILFFLMLLSYISNMITGNNLKNTESQLEETRVQLATREKELSDIEQALIVTMKQVDDAKADLQQLTINLDEVKLTLAAKEEDLAAQDKLLSDQKAMLSEQEKQLSTQQQQLSSQQQQLSSQQQRIAEQEEYLAAATDELLEMRGQMQTIAVLRLSILEQIRDSVVAVMGDASKVSIGDNGAIVLDEGVLFDFGSSAIKPAARPTLDRLVEVFRSFLSDDENARYVDSIIISGHTDSIGTDAENRVLSTARANAVLNYLLTAQKGELDAYAQYFCAAGYGATRPVASNDTDEGRAQNRRIEISITLRDDTIMDIVESYLDLELPEGAAAQSGSGNG